VNVILFPQASSLIRASDELDAPFLLKGENRRKDCSLRRALISETGFEQC